MNGNPESTDGEATGIISRDDLLKSIVDSGLAEADSVNPTDGDHAPSPEADAAEAVKAEAQAARPETKAETRTEAKPAATKPREQKAAERADRTWEEINAEKARLAQERAALAAEKAKAKAPAPAHTPEDYEAIARDFESEGRDDLAKIARNRAAQARQEAEQARASAQRTEFEQKRLGIIQQTVGANPDLNRPGTELFQAVEKLIRERPVLLHYPEGFAHAVEAVKANLKAGRAEALEKEVGELKQKLADYEQKLQPGIGSPSSGSRAVNFEELTPAERRNRLLSQLKAAEGAGEFQL